MLLLFFSLAFAVENPFRSEVQPVQIEQGSQAEIEILLVVPPGFHLYRDMMHIEIHEDATLLFQEAKYPVGLFKKDPANPSQFREQYNQNVNITLPFQYQKDGRYEAKIEVGYQGCKDGLCYRPAKDLHEISINITPPAQGSPDLEKKDLKKNNLEKKAPPKESNTKKPQDNVKNPTEDSSSFRWLAIAGILGCSIVALLFFRNSSANEKDEQ